VTEALACSARRASRTPAQDLKVKITGITARMVKTVASVDVIGSMIVGLEIGNDEYRRITRDCSAVTVPPRRQEAP
jgi:hypothetical protein